LVLVAILLIVAIYFLPKAVVENESQLQQGVASNPGQEQPANPHTEAPPSLRKAINRLRARYLSTLPEEKNAIFADSLVGLYSQAGQFDSAAWYAEKAATFFKTDESLLKAGNAYYEAYSFAVDADKQKVQAEKTREYFEKILEKNPDNLE